MLSDTGLLTESDKEEVRFQVENPTKMKFMRAEIGRQNRFRHSNSARWIALLALSAKKGILLVRCGRSCAQ